MKIQKTNQTFNGIKIATARAKVNGAVTKYDLYNITSKDSEFLDKLVQGIDLQKLWPGLEKFDYLFWYRKLTGMINYAKIDGAETVLIANEGRPCGGINYLVKQNKCNTAYRVTWPVETGMKAPFAGKILYLQLFKKCLEEGINSIKTVASLCGPFDTFAKCLQLGFSTCGGDDYNEVMTIYQGGMQKAINKFENYVEITKIPKSEQVDLDLEKILKID